MKSKILAIAAVTGGMVSIPMESGAALVSVTGPNSSAGVAPTIVAPPPATVINSVVANRAQQGFDERQGVLLGSSVSIDGGGSIAAGTVVDSHMIFLNKPDNVSGSLTHGNVVWTFSGPILGVMSDVNGGLEAASTPTLGLPTTTYATFNNRGFEGNDAYSINGNQLTVSMGVTQPGDWIRVVTASRSVPDGGSTAGLMALGMLGLLRLRRRFAARRAA